MTMTIVRPTWQREITFKNWTKGRDNSLVLVTAPAKEKGQTFLKLDIEMWNWNPTINRLIKLPPSMMAQGWMGSDFSNDDLLKESSIVVDYKHEIIGEEDIEHPDEVMDREFSLLLCLIFECIEIDLMYSAVHRISGEGTDQIPGFFCRCAFDKQVHA